MTIPASSPWQNQLALFAAILWIKPIYTLLSAVLIFILLKVKSSDLAALRWGLISFLAGESFCAANIIWFDDGNYFLELLHMGGMLASLAFVTWAAMEGMDSRLLNFSDPEKKCSALSLCHRCVKYGPAVCGLNRLLHFLIPALMVLAAIPLLAITRAASYQVEILGVLHTYSHPVAYQIIEIRYVPTAAIILFAASLVILLRGKTGPARLSKALLAGGIGALGFSFLRLVLVGVYRENLLWFTFWEELTELIYISGIGFVLWTFRKPLLPQEDEHRPSQTTT